MNSSSSDLIKEIRGLLEQGLVDVFATLFQLKVAPSARADLPFGDEPVVAGNVGVCGELNAAVYVCLRTSFARRLTAQMLNWTSAEPINEALVTDVVGELSNMIVGSAKSQLCDGGHPCLLTLPTIVRGHQVATGAIRGTETGRFALTCAGEPIVVTILLKRSLAAAV